jgi:hypothetical protein
MTIKQISAGKTDKDGLAETSWKVLVRSRFEKLSTPGH